MGSEMTKEDIIRMARTAGCHDNGEEFRFVEFRYLERFAALVAAAEREACAKLCDELDAMNWSDFGEYKSGYSDEIRKRGRA